MPRRILGGIETTLKGSFCFLQFPSKILTGEADEMICLGFSTERGVMGRKMGGRFKRESIHVYLWLIHVKVWQKTTKFCKAIILQLKNKILKIYRKKNEGIWNRNDKCWCWVWLACARQKKGQLQRGMFLSLTSPSSWEPGLLAKAFGAEA